MGFYWAGWHLVIVAADAIELKRIETNRIESAVSAGNQRREWASGRVFGCNFRLWRTQFASDKSNKKRERDAVIVNRMIWRTNSLFPFRRDSRIHLCHFRYTSSPPALCARQPQQLPLRASLLCSLEHWRHFLCAPKFAHIASAGSASGARNVINYKRSLCHNFAPATLNRDGNICNWRRKRLQSIRFSYNVLNLLFCQRFPLLRSLSCRCLEPRSSCKVVRRGFAGSGFPCDCASQCLSCSSNNGCADLTAWCGPRSLGLRIFPALHERRRRRKSMIVSRPSISRAPSLQDIWNCFCFGADDCAICCAMGISARQWELSSNRAAHAAARQEAGLCLNKPAKDVRLRPRR